LFAELLLARSIEEGRVGQQPEPVYLEGGLVAEVGAL
jgi:hypothetical protein